MLNVEPRLRFADGMRACDHQSDVVFLFTTAKLLYALENSLQQLRNWKVAMAAQQLEGTPDC